MPTTRVPGFGPLPSAAVVSTTPAKIPAGPPVRLGHLQGTPCFAAVERNRSDPDDDFVAVRIAQADFADRQPVGQRWIDNYGTDLLRHEHSPPVADG